MPLSAPASASAFSPPVWSAVAAPRRPPPPPSPPASRVRIAHRARPSAPPRRRAPVAAPAVSRPRRRAADTPSQPAAPGAAAAAAAAASHRHTALGRRLAASHHHLHPVLPPPPSDARAEHPAHSDRRPEQGEQPGHRQTHADPDSDSHVHPTSLAEHLDKHQQDKALRKRNKPAKRGRPRRAAAAAAASRRSPSTLKDTFQAYMDEISREDLLDQAQVITLANDIKAGLVVENTERAMHSRLSRRPSVHELAKELGGIAVADVQKRRMAGTAAKNALVAANLRLVTSVARKVSATKGPSTAGIALDDMVQEGSVGLIRAAEKFDAARGYKFSTYATWWVRAYVMRSITTQSRSIKVPSTIVDEYSRIRKEYIALREAGIFNPSEDEVAKALDITPAKLRFVVNVVTRVPASLDLSLSADGDVGSRTLGELIKGDDDVQERMVEDMQRKELDKALRQCLKPLERAVIRLRFGLDDGQARTLRETGELLGLSKERIRQLIFRALPKMKTPEIERMLTDAITR